MAKLYYGNGICSIKSSEDVLGVEIRYKGNVSISRMGSSQLVVNRNNGIIVVSLDTSPLTDLFTYVG